jgi:hypothetical protein
LRSHAFVFMFTSPDNEGSGPAACRSVAGIGPQDNATVVDAHLRPGVYTGGGLGQVRSLPISRRVELGPLDPARAPAAARVPDQRPGSRRANTTASTGPARSPRSPCRDLKTRNATPELWLPPSAQLPRGLGPFLSVPCPGPPGPDGSRPLERHRPSGPEQ